MQSGRQFFAVSFLPADGHGEGNTGPRASQRTAMWYTALHDPLQMPFLRINGLDSQSCFACHNSAGTYVPPGQSARTQKPGGVGGAGDFAAALLSSSQFPDRLSHILRAPPRAFGSAYLQELAEEMTGNLLDIKQQAITQASQNPGTIVTKALIAKGINFGSISVQCPFSEPDPTPVEATAQSSVAASSTAPPSSTTYSCSNPKIITANVVGVSPDLIVRPLQHKGVAATLRSFVKSALAFHHSMQAVEVVGINTDCDADGLINEMAVDNISPAANESSVQVQESLGDVAALSAFTGMLRPPGVSATISYSAQLGKTIFADIGCTNCHVPSLNTNPHPQFKILLAHPAPGCPTNCGPYGCQQLGSFAEADATVQPAVQAVNATKSLATNQTATATTTYCPSGFYCIDLTNPGSGLPDEFLPRLPANSDGTVTVPLYSDLKRHAMGYDLEQLSPEQADDAGTNIANELWLTSKLWGVADNGPWLHDGRARTIKEAIVMHGGDAATEAANFVNLSVTQQQAVLDFLNTLIIPPSP